MALRKRREQEERDLSPFASRSEDSRGREWPEAPDPLRTPFQRDRDRIIHTNAFRRLMHKTQVFIAPSGDHYATRLTHTLEVSQVARTVVRALRLNEDLAEAISLGHDLGHTPFGHVGEEVLDQLYRPGFRHNEQSLRVVDRLEREGRGLNLTWEVRRGIRHHSKPGGEIFKDADDTALPLEAQVCRLADAVAYLNHDVADAIRAGMIGEDALPTSAKKLLGRGHSRRINAMVWDIVETSWPATGEATLPEAEKPSISMSLAMKEVMGDLWDFLWHNVYQPRSLGRESQIARRVLTFLYRHFCGNPGGMPQEYLDRDDTVERAVVDYVAGMTDHYALHVAENIQPGITEGLLPWRV
jgi:dGTPase